MCFRVVLFLLLASILSAQQEPDQIMTNAIQAQQRGDYQSAIEAYRAVLKLRPENVEAKVNLGAALAHVGKFDEAILMYQSALPSLSVKNPVLLNLGLAYYKKGDLVNARRQFESLHQLEPANVQVAILLGDSEVKLGNSERAASMLQQLEPANSGNPDFEYVLGTAMIKSGHRREGVPRVEAAAQAGTSGDAYMLAGATLLELDEYQRARHDLEEALRLDPKLRGLHTL